MKQILYKLFEHQYLGRDEARTILQNIAQGKYNDVQVASLITVFLMRNISVEELCGFRDALLEMRIPVDLSEFAPIDIVGTGGDGKNTFNISTASCFTVAGAGFPVVKHGNYGATSVSGASNVMEQHGVKFTSDVDQLRRSMDIISYGFGEYRTIQDYPIRGRATYLHVRKRKWLDKSSNEIFSYDWDLSEFDGTRLNSEFVSFLKEGD